MFYNDIITIDDWLPAGEYEGMYPKGARDKSCFISPDHLPEEYRFLKTGHYYLFKESNERYPWQFWIEIIAYRLGRFMNIEVPPVYIGFKNGEKKYGALIEWFYDDECSYIDGSMVMKSRIENYDTKKGTQHNLETILDSVEKQAVFVEHWGKVLLFDSIIGNNDRHQDNWGIVYKKVGIAFQDIHFSPAFDNGTSMGNEILEDNFENFNDRNRLNKYLLGDKAKHHMKYNLQDTGVYNFTDFMIMYITEYKFVKNTLRNCLDFNFGEFAESVSGLTDILTSDLYRLTGKRLDFILMLLKERIRLMKEAIDNI
jgi:hypothetical protein